MFEVGTVQANSATMLGGTVPLVGCPIEMWGVVVHAGHQRITVNLGNDGRRGDGGDEIVAFHQTVNRALRVDAEAAVAAISVGINDRHQSPEDLHIRPAQSASIDLGGRDLRDRPGDRGLPDRLSGNLTLARGEQLAVAQILVAKTRREYHGAGDERSGECAAADLVHPAEPELPPIRAVKCVGHVLGQP